MTATPPNFIDDPRFSRTFELQADLVNGRPSSFKLNYADYGYQDESRLDQENVFLFFGSLLGSRLIHVAKDKLAKEHRIRFIDLDSPGNGGTDAIKAEHRLSIWLEAIPALLQHLGIRHVSIGCHSGGTIAALDLLLHHPEILHPDRPYLAIGAPWILPSHTGLATMSIVQALPASLISKADNLARLINNRIGPMVGACFGLSQVVVAKLAPSALSWHAEDTNKDAMLEDDLWPKIIKRVYDEGVQGISTDAVVLMQKVDSRSGWSDWGDYDVLVPRLANTLQAAGRTLRVDVFYAENDALIGDPGSKGPLWFDRCWDVEYRGDTIDYYSATVKGADHDGVWSMKWDAVHEVFGRIGRPAREPLSNVSY